MLINTRYVILYDLNLRIVTQVKYYRYYPYLIEKARKPKIQFQTE